jgi:peptide deformylase
MIRPILKYGDRGLASAAAPVSELDDRIRQLITDMVETMYAAPGIGLAATQLGIPLRVLVVDTSAGRQDGRLIALVNPEIVERTGSQLEEEGCLSVPGFNATVLRPARVVLRGLDMNGAEQIVEGKDVLARAFQHEMDHLDGTLFVDRLRGIRREMIVRKIHKLQRCGRW